jgi:hypothetical protein
MLNLWKDEYARRKRLCILDPLPNIFNLEGEKTRTEIPHDQLKKTGIKEVILKNLRDYSREEK